MVEKGGTPSLRYNVILTNPIIVELSEAPPVHSQMTQISFWLCNLALHQVVVVRGHRVSVASTPPSKTLQRISSTKHPPRCNFQRQKKCFRFGTISSSGPFFFLWHTCPPNCIVVTCTESATFPHIGASVPTWNPSVNELVRT